MDDTVRLAAGVALIVGCALAGRAISGALRRRAALLGDCSAALRALERTVCARRLPLTDALRETSYPLFALLSKHCAETFDAPGAGWAVVREAQRQRGGLLFDASDSDLASLDRLFDALGQGDASAQGEWIREAENALRTSGDAARKKQAETGKLYASLGALTGLALAVLLY